MVTRTPFRHSEPRFQRLKGRENRRYPGTPIGIKAILLRSSTPCTDEIYTRGPATEDQSTGLLR
jgi:hypothetical protein